ncbi:hypothetical protein DTW90_11590 [Neorhizobium sp. P12A]|uniref:hypothetical protein n=1 Tax=Rhizobium/Agrobacterium group TaxID=227290 RepID=UPI001047CAD7|nr:MULTISPECIES: hypothetical protein [Rhizobium/Agrobacterium group]KAA0699945.1 hypothetical protein DTW90_11590 [Neorhizobium sp. P12A]
MVDGRLHRDLYGWALTMPLEVLWDDKGDFGRKVRDLTTEDIRTLLKAGPVQFVEADVGKRLRWVPESDRFDYWKAIKPNLFEDGKHHLDDYPNGFFLAASEWSGRQGETIVALEKHH